MNPDATIVAGMATMPSRYDIVEHAVASIAPQVDRVYLYVNDQSGGSPKCSFPDNVDLIHSRHHDGDLKDAGKFWGLQHHDEAFYISCDDDLTYPPTYVDDLWSQIERRAGQSACSYHGCVAPTGVVDSYYNNQGHKVHWREAQDRPLNVNILGTGVMGIYTPTVDIPMDIFGEEPMADLYVAAHFQEQGVPCVALPHPKRWIRKVVGAEDTPEISNDEHMDRVQARFVSQRNWMIHQ